ncbi:MAG: hypothetical protein NT055_10390 [Nitrospirae bacterium]|nr:hypothetical protein [Nitrospirota bacterium]
MKAGKIYASCLLIFFFLILVHPSIAFTQSFQCIQCHTNKENLQAIIKLIPKKHKSLEAEGTG